MESTYMPLNRTTKSSLMKPILSCSAWLSPWLWSWPPPPYKLFENKSESNALQRYVHYEQACVRGELDPNLRQFDVWELRQVVNSDASEEELSWGRQSLINYRPDTALLDDPLWRYCRIVKSDVPYKTPDW